MVPTKYDSQVDRRLRPRAAGVGSVFCAFYRHPSSDVRLLWPNLPETLQKKKGCAEA